MPNSEKTNSRIKSVAFVDYKPAELHIKKDWIIVYYSKNPLNQKLERFRLRAPAMADRILRLKHAKKIVAEINAKLATGWSPFLEESGKNFKSWSSAVDDFLKYVKKQHEVKVFRADTVKSYNSNINMIQEFIKLKNKKIVFALQINNVFCVEYLDWIYLEKNRSAVTRNNHLVFLKLFCNFLLSRGILKENSATAIQHIKVPKKTREYIPVQLRKEIAEKLKTYDHSFDVACQLTYYCFIRSTEMVNLKAYMIDLSKNSIFIPETISKNKKSSYITIPQQLHQVLKIHLANCNLNDYIFSEKFRPGKEKINIRKIQSAWDILRSDLGFESKYQFYSYKDTGITDLLMSGVPAIKVRDQARHYDIKITELYTSRNLGCDETIRYANISF